MAVTGIRSEYDILSSVFRAIQNDRRLELGIVVTGAHLSPTYGHTVSEIERDGFRIVDRIENLIDSDTASSRARGAAFQLAGLLQTVSRVQPDILLVLGDREEAMNGALAGTYLGIPVAHISGGDRATHSLDDSIRHAVTKLSHIHFPTSEDSAERIQKLGENDRFIFNFGNPGLDRLVTTERMSKRKLLKSLGFDGNGVKHPLLLVIQHPLSREVERSFEEMRQTMEAVKALGLTTVVNYPNSDAGGRAMIRCIRQYANLGHVRTFQNLPRRLFVNLYRHASCLLGNSSSGILESPFLKLPVVNVGERQKGRSHLDNVRFVPHDAGAIVRAVRQAVYDDRYREKIQRCSNPYGDGTAAKRIANVLATIPIGERLIIKEITY